MGLEVFVCLCCFCYSGNSSSKWHPGNYHNTRMCPTKNGVGILSSASLGDQSLHCSIPKDEPHSPVSTGVAAYRIPNSPSQADLQAFQLRSSLNPDSPHLHGIILKLTMIIKTPALVFHLGAMVQNRHHKIYKWTHFLSRDSCVPSHKPPRRARLATPLKAVSSHLPKPHLLV